MSLRNKIRIPGTVAIMLRYVVAFNKGTGFILASVFVRYPLRSRLCACACAD